MAWRILAAITKLDQKLSFSKRVTPFNPIVSPFLTSSFSTSFLVTKTPKKFRKKRKKPSARSTLVQQQSSLIPHFEDIVFRDNYFRFLIRCKQFLTKQPQHILPLIEAETFHQQLGFPRGHKVTKFIAHHPLLFEVYRHNDNTMWMGMTDFMEGLLEEEQKIMESREMERLKVVKKLLMMSKERRMPLSRIYHNRILFGIPDDFRDWVLKFPEDLRVVNGANGSRTLELVKWDPLLAVSTLEYEFMVNEEKVRRAFEFPLKHGKSLDLDKDDVIRLNLLNTLPLVSPYSDGWKHELETLEAEKYRVGIIHEFLHLTLEKKASMHHIMEFKEELSLIKHTYHMLLKQQRSFYLAGTETNWVVFLKDGYDKNGNLIEKDPQVAFYERLYRYAEMQDPEELDQESTDKKL